MSAALRVGLLGLGAMGRHHLRALRSLSGVRPVAVADPAGDRSGTAGALPVLRDVGALIEHGVDYCVVATPTGTHLQVGLVLAAAGVPALIEKPLAADALAGALLAAAFERRGLPVAVGHVERFHPALRALRGRVGELGGVHLVRSRRCGPHPARRVDVGVVRDLASHDVDLAGWLTRQRYAAVSAHLVSARGAGYEDHAVLRGRLTDGTPTRHLVSWRARHRERLTALDGEHGRIVADSLAGLLTVRIGGRTERPVLPAGDPLLAQHEAFRDLLLGRPADLVSARAAVHALAVTQGALRAGVSTRKGRMPEVTHCS